MKSEYKNEEAYLAHQRARFLKNSVQEIRRTDASRGWLDGLRQYQDIEFVFESLVHIHSPPLKFYYLVRRQAESIKYCLQQFFEYFEASKSRPYSRPTLMYYALMYLAIVEVLWKLDGRYSLARLRQRHPHHGLEFHIDEDAAAKADPASLWATIAKNGTFNIWNRIAVLSVLAGEERVHHLKIPAILSRAGVLFTGDGKKALAFRSATLADLARISPTCWERGLHSRLGSDLVRASVSRDYYEETKTSRISIVVQPADAKVLTTLYSKFHFRIGDLNDVNVIEYPSGVNISMEIASSDFRNVRAPEVFNVDRNLVFFRADDLPLNEFGIIYVASYIGGMFARYYPELWAKCVDSHNLISQIIGNMMDAAEERAPLLLLGELRGVEYIFK